MTSVKKVKNLFLFIVFFVCLQSCSTISLFDQHAYETSTSIKVDVLNLMDKATDEYSAKQEEIREIEIKIDKAYEYEKGRPKNSISVKMWEKIKDPYGGLFGEFLKYWQNQGKLSSVYITEKKKIISDAFDDVIELESKKIKAE
jgi:hypothetical protein